MILEPGKVYKATVDGVPTTVLVADDGHDILTSTRIRGFVTHGIAAVTDARPLIVLDLKGMCGAPVLSGVLRDHGYDWLAEQIEAQTKPPRIEEPGLWGVVDARVAGGTWSGHALRDGVNEGDGLDWILLTSERPRGASRRIAWADLIDPTLIRDGIES